MNKYFIMPYRMGSKSSRALARELNVTRVFPNKRYRGRPNHILINWGYARQPDVPVKYCKEILNPFSSIPYVSNKLQFFKYDSEARKVPYTTNIEEAKDFIQHYGVVYCRVVLNGRGGRGIVIAEHPDQLVDASLYTAKIKGKEYRVHVFKGNAFHIQQKRKMSSEKLEELGITHTKGIRNHENGYVFTINDMETPSQDTISQAIQVINDYALDFGAVDIIENKIGKGYVLEINSAPGLEGTTLDKYTQIFKNYLL